MCFLIVTKVKYALAAKQRADLRVCSLEVTNFHLHVAVLTGCVQWPERLLTFKCVISLCRL